MSRAKRTSYPTQLLFCALALAVGCDSSDEEEDPEQEEPEQEEARDAGAQAPDAKRDARAVTPLDAEVVDEDVGRVDAGADSGRSSPGDAAADASTTGLASALDGLFIDVPCSSDTPTPLAKGATCLHPGSTQQIDRKLEFGGEAGKTYDVKLRVRGIWEPTSISNGTRPDNSKLPFTTGGTVTTGAGDPINYQQYFIKVSEPKQTYWLNDYRYVAHDIHKEDYEATIRVAGGADVTVSMNDGNDHQIANWTGDFFSGLAPYADKPSTGQLLRLDVLSVSAR